MAHTTPATRAVAQADELRVAGDSAAGRRRLMRVATAELGSAPTAGRLELAREARTLTELLPDRQAFVAHVARSIEATRARLTLGTMPPDRLEGAPFE